MRLEEVSLKKQEAQQKLEVQMRLEEVLLFDKKSQNGRKRNERETELATMTEEEVHFIPATYDDGQQDLWKGNDAEIDDSDDSFGATVSSVISSLPSFEDVSDFLKIIPKYIKTPERNLRQRIPGFVEPSYKYRRDLDHLDKDE